MATGTTVRVLGPVELRVDDEVATVDGLKRRQVLAVLVAARGHPVPEARLCEALWEHQPPETATATLQSHVSRLRRAVRPIEITSTAAGYTIELAHVELDAARFEGLFADARSLTGPPAADHLHEALRLWRGRAFGDLAELVGVRGEALRLEELRLVATEEWFEARLAAGECSEVIGELDALLVDHPLRERFSRQVMVALYRDGRQGEALARAERLRRLLRDDFGLDPSPGLQDLETRILADDPALLVVPARRRTEEAPRRSTDATSLIGREDDVERVLDAIEHHDVVTVSGPGGVGKTRVAFRAVTAAEIGFADGVAVVELAPVRQSSAVVEVVARALDVQQRQHRSLDDSVVDFLVDKQLLVVLDNCEHVIEHIAALVDKVRHRCAGVGILATSRVPLGLPAEHVHVLAPLAAPAADADPESISAAPAGQLFVERAAAARPGFELDERCAPAVAEICRRLDGLPLAIELAAARVRTMGPEALAARLDQRFSLLGGGRRGVDERHHTLRGVVEWSYDLLDPVEQEAFVQLSVFAGSFGLSAAEAVCRVGDGGSTLTAIVDLVDKSMLRLDDPDEPRYVVLETMREFGQERLGATEELRALEERHRSWYLRLATEAEVCLDTADEGMWTDRLDREIDNIRAAHASAVRAGDLDVASGLVVALHEYSFRRIRYEVAGFAETTMAMPGFRGSPTAPVVAGVAAYGRWVRGDLESAIELATSALEQHELTDAPSYGLLERVLGNATFYEGRIDEALVWLDRMVDAAHASGRPAQLAHALYMSSVARTSVGRHDLGVAFAEDAAEAATSAGSPTALAEAAYARGLALRSSDTTESEAHLRRSAELGERAGNRWIRAFALTEVHWLNARHGNLAEGLAGYAEVIDTWHRGGDWANLWLSLRHVFGIMTQLGHHEAAAVVHGALVAAGAAYALPFEPADAERLEHHVGQLRRVLGPAPFATAVRRGTAMSDSEIVAYVQAEIAQVTGRV
ncbi:MAG: helix-turn-helix domain-containing protein [Ilumatobacter sp.]|nr:MAG: helix-turn-helix domain-containing protein [Ilumatobacter sp.]